MRLHNRKSSLLARLNFCQKQGLLFYELALSPVLGTRRWFLFVWCGAHCYKTRSNVANLVKRVFDGLEGLKLVVIQFVNVNDLKVRQMFTLVLLQEGHEVFVGKHTHKHHVEVHKCNCFVLPLETKLRISHFTRKPADKAQRQ